MRSPWFRYIRRCGRLCCFSGFLLQTMLRPVIGVYTVHIFAGFGMAGLPGVWKILFQDVLIGMARSEQQLTLPVPVFVDDAAIIGPDPHQVNAEAASLLPFYCFGCGYMYEGDQD